MRIRLDETNLATFFVVHDCCGIRQLVKEELLLELREIRCMACRRPALRRQINGDWHTTDGATLF
ncbi:hypothetical protein IDH44_12365 [Paenibacillus sp. IB182496]|uniref:Uncharacterized protein n=1 Tax=Paenibacillus sabuli TaxID=2772509 RepID=A0A927BUJ0_9BACL|nr:hypothetical protein [Paenibacillus sabuli]MBD2845990.1 hypothetical protein [Paenibacillus sabuli]